MRVLVVSADRTAGSGHPQNIGDALLTDLLVDAFRRRGHDARALDLGDARRRDGAPRVRAAGVRGLSRAVSGVDAVVLGGGTLFQDDQPGQAFAGLPRLCAATAGFARLHGKRYAVFGVGVDPVERRRARAALRFAASPGRVWVRDVASMERVREVTGRGAALAADVSLLGATEVSAIARPEGDRAGAVLALNRTEAARLRPRDLEALSAAYGHVRFVSMDQGADADAHAVDRGLERAMSGLDVPPRSWRDVARDIAGARVVVASRMHAMYLAAMLGVDIAALAPTPKTRSFADEFGVPVIASAADGAQQRGRADAAKFEAARSRADTRFEEVAQWLES